MKRLALVLCAVLASQCNRSPKKDRRQSRSVNSTAKGGSKKSGEGRKSPGPSLVPSKPSPPGIKIGLRTDLLVRIAKWRFVRSAARTSPKSIKEVRSEVSKMIGDDFSRPETLSRWGLTKGAPILIRLFFGNRTEFDAAYKALVQLANSRPSPDRVAKETYDQFVSSIPQAYVRAHFALPVDDPKAFVGGLGRRLKVAGGALGLSSAYVRLKGASSSVAGDFKPLASLKPAGVFGFSDGSLSVLLHSGRTVHWHHFTPVKRETLAQSAKGVRPRLAGTGESHLHRWWTSRPRKNVLFAASFNANSLAVNNRMISIGQILDALRQARPDERRLLARRGLTIATSTERLTNYPIRFFDSFQLELGDSSGKPVLRLEWTLTDFGLKALGPVVDKLKGKNLTRAKVWCSGFLESMNKAVVPFPGTTQYAKFSSKEVFAALSEAGIQMWVWLFAQGWPFVITSSSIRADLCKLAPTFRAAGVKKITLTRKDKVLNAVLE